MVSPGNLEEGAGLEYVRKLEYIDQNKWNYIHAVNWWSTAWKCDTGMLSITQITWIVVDHKMRGHITAGCKC